jgi:hypothetical protein
MEPRAPTTDELRNRSDAGDIGDKVSFPDPAAAALGTDAEAGGSPPTVAERKLAAKQPAGPAQHRQDSGMLIYPLLIAAVFIIVIAAAVVAFRG